MPQQYPHCQSETVVKNGTRCLQDDSVVQSYRCRDCQPGTPMARLRTPSSVVEFALKNRSEGMGASEVELNPVDLPLREALTIRRQEVSLGF